MRTLFKPYKMGSKGCRALATELGKKRILPDNRSRFRAREGDTVINWGNSRNSRAFAAPAKVVNWPERVANAANKLNCLTILCEEGVSAVGFTSSVDTAAAWAEEGHKVFCRTLLTANSGDGIVVADDVDSLVPAPLYTKGVDKEYECRVHVVDGEAFDFQQKRKRSGGGAHDEDVWNHGGSYVFCRNELSMDEALVARCMELGADAVNALGLDFAAVDICVSAEGVARVLEVNTAPGLVNTTLKKYAEKFKEKYCA